MEYPYGKQANFPPSFPLTRTDLFCFSGSRGPAVLDDFTSSYGYKFSDAAGYQWPTTSAMATANKL